MSTTPTPAKQPDFSIILENGAYTVSPNNVTALCWLIAHTTPPQQRLKQGPITAVLDHAEIKRFCSEAEQEHKTCAPIPAAATNWLALGVQILAGGRTMPPTWARLKELYMKNPKELRGGLHERHSGYLPSCSFLQENLLPHGFTEVVEWADGYFRAVFICDEHRAIITYCEGDFDLEEYPDEPTYAAAIAFAREFYLKLKPKP